MSKRERRLHDPRHARRVAVAAKGGYALVLTILISILLAVIFGLGTILWPQWIVAHRSAIIGALGLIIWVVLAAWPLVDEVSKHPRPLSGPGKNPYTGWGP